jgi:hypothetical protein
LLDRVQSEDLAWKESGAAFISSITRLLERLLDYRSVIEGDENRDKRMSCTFNLLVRASQRGTTLSNGAFAEFLQERVQPEGNVPALHLQTARSSPLR